MLSQVKNYYEKLVPLSEEEWNLLEPKFRIKHLNKGDKLQSEGEICNDVTFCNRGLLKSYHYKDGKEYIEVFFSENQYLSDYSSFISRTPGRLYIEAMEECELVLLDYDTVQMLYERVDNFQRFGRLIAEHLFTQLCLRNSSLLFETPEERYIEFSKNRPDLIQRVPQYMIASYLGVTPEALSRIRKRLAVPA